MTRPAIERLRALYEQLTMVPMSFQENTATEAAAISEIFRDLPALLAAAERYAYLRSVDIPMPRVDCHWTHKGECGRLLAGIDLDSAIDAALARKEG